MTRSPRILLEDVLESIALIEEYGKGVTRARIRTHEYFRVDLELAWDMVHHNVPELKRNVEAILAEMGE